MRTSMTEKSLRDEEEQSRDIEAKQGRHYKQERWLWRVMNYRVNASGEDGGTRVKIPKVTWKVSDKTCYEPEAVSIGPYHHNNPKLSYFQELKDGFAFSFVDGSPSVQAVCDNFSNAVAEARGYYSQDALGGMTDEEFREVMFLDGCFVLEFMSRLQRTGGFTTQSPMDFNRIDSVVRDLLLLDNQVPFMVLEALDGPLKRLTSDAVNLFAYAFSYDMFPGITYDKFPKKTQPTHLLDFLSLWLYDPRDKPPRIVLSGEWMACPSVTRLEEAGIDCRPTHSPRVTAIRFTPKILTAELKIPSMYVEEDSKPHWMNLAAYQIYVAGDKQASRRCYIGAAEYIWMMEKLIDDAKDVKKLRAKQIILHSLGEDHKVVGLFQTMSQNIASDLLGMNAKFPVPWDKAFAKERLLMEEIQNHLRSKFKRWGYRNLYHPYFRSPWSIPAFFAGFIGLVLTFLQVYYAIYPRH